MVLGHERDHSSRWAAVVSIASKIGCTGQTLNKWVRGIRFCCEAPNLRPQAGAEMRSIASCRCPKR